MSNIIESEFPPYSVLMSVYINERPDYLKEAIDSISSQTVAPNEIVIVEDGPLTEDLYQVLNDYSNKIGESFVRVKNDENLGLGLALNKGLNVCSNELIARMDTDDISCLDRCEKQLFFLMENPDIDVIGGQISEFIDSEDSYVSKRIVPCTHEEICNFMKFRDPFNHPTVMFKKSAVLAAGNYLDFHFNEDYFLWIRMFLNNARFANLNDVLLNMRVSSDLYARRGGLSYYRAQKKLLKFMREKRMITFAEYCRAKLIRFVVQVLMPNKMRKWAYGKFVREK